MQVPLGHAAQVALHVPKHPDFGLGCGRLSHIAWCPVSRCLGVRVSGCPGVRVSGVRCPVSGAAILLLCDRLMRDAIGWDWLRRGWGGVEMGGQPSPTQHIPTSPHPASSVEPSSIKPCPPQLSLHLDRHRRKAYKDEFATFASVSGEKRLLCMGVVEGTSK